MYSFFIAYGGQPHILLTYADSRWTELRSSLTQLSTDKRWQIEYGLETIKLRITDARRQRFHRHPFLRHSILRNVSPVSVTCDVYLYVGDPVLEC